MINSTFDGFTDREEKLKKITRFNIYPHMFYRTNLFLHSQRVYTLIKDFLQAISQSYGDELNTEKTLALALVHDDAEIITGDIQLYHKDRMTKEELEKLDKEEAEAIEQITKKWPLKVNGFSYKELLYHALYKDCLEAQIVSYTDKVDAYCECLHEVHAGNKLFINPANDYNKRIRKFAEKFPLLNKIFPGNHALLNKLGNLDTNKILEKADLHNSVSVKQSTGISHYDRWKKLTIKYLGIEALTEIQESK